MNKRLFVTPEVWKRDEEVTSALTDFECVYSLATDNTNFHEYSDLFYS